MMQQMLLAGGPDLFTTLLLHADGSNGATTTTDSSSKNNTMVMSNGAALSTAQFKFGTASIALDGSDDVVTTNSDTTNFDFGTGDFTIELWARANALSGSGHNGVISTFNSTLTQGPFRIESDNISGQRFVAFARFSDATEQSINGTTVITTGTWYHIAFVRQGTTFTLYVDGVSNGSFTSSKTMQTTPSTGLILGRLYTTGSNFYWNGWLDEIRISKGIARYTGAFTPPAAPFTY